jgi:integrase
MAKTGSIRERVLADGSSAWILVWGVGGRQVKKTVRGSQRDAERVLTAALAARDRGEHRAPDSQPFKNYAERWLESKRTRIEPSTWDDYSAHVRLRLVPAFGKLRIRQITRSAIERYLAELDAKVVAKGEKREGERLLRRKTINGSLIPLRGVLDRAVQDGIILANSARGRGIELADETPEMRYLTRDDVAAYLEACSKPYRPLAELLIATGLRLGEALGLEWRDVDFDASSLRITRALKRSGIGSTKTDRPRVVYVDFAGQQLGHRDPRSTMRYLHVDPEAHRDAAEKAAAWRRRSTG